MAIEYAIWGDVGEGEQLLFTRDPSTNNTQPITCRAVADALASIATKRGAKAVRIQAVDLSACPSSDWKA